MSDEEEKVRAEIQTIEGNCLWLLKAFIKEHPDLPTNYAKAILLYWREIDGLEIPDEWLEMKLSNPWSVGRLFSKVKKDFLGELDKKILAEKEAAWKKIIPEDSEIDDAMNSPPGQELVKEIARGLKSQCGQPESFDCRRCGKTFTPKKGQWIFYNLCDECFLPFDIQKMRGRFSGLGGKEPIPYFESVEEWMKAEMEETRKAIEKIKKSPPKSSRPWREVLGDEEDP